MVGSRFNKPVEHWLRWIVFAITGWDASQVFKFYTEFIKAVQMDVRTDCFTNASIFNLISSQRVFSVFLQQAVQLKTCGMKKRNISFLELA